MNLKFKLVGVLVISICTLFFTEAALGSIIDVGVYSDGVPVGPANIYIDNGNSVGQTGIDGILNNIYVDPGTHIVIAKWNDRRGERSFTAPSDSHTWLRIDVM
jgi:hypothetical protein